MRNHRLISSICAETFGDQSSPPPLFCRRETEAERRKSKASSLSQGDLVAKGVRAPPSHKQGWGLKPGLQGWKRLRPGWSSFCLALAWPWGTHLPGIKGSPRQCHPSLCLSPWKVGLGGVVAAGPPVVEGPACQAPHVLSHCQVCWWGNRLPGLGMG